MCTRTNIHTDKTLMTKHIFSLTFVALTFLEENLRLKGE